jgi:hypothetical protein
MLLAPDTPSRVSPLTRHDSVFVLVLVMTLLLATAAFFGPFALPALAVGLLLSVVLHRWAGDADVGDVSGEQIRLVPINIARVHVGGDTGGLIFVLGSIAILALGLPTLRWFLIGSVIVATVTATARITWAAAHPRDHLTHIFRNIVALV